MITLVLVLSFHLVILMDVPNDTSDPAFPVILYKFASGGSCVLLGAASLAVIFMPRALKCTSAARREKIVVVMILYFQVVNIFDKYHVSKMLGHSDPLLLFPDLEGRTDSLMLIDCFMFLLVSHVCLPIRWFLLVTTEVLGVVIYGTIVFVLGRPEPQSTICFAQFLILVILLAMGKRQSEVNERLVFSSMLAEKSLRMRAEFQLSQALDRNNHGKGLPDDNDDGASYAPTTATAEVFTGLDSVGESRPNLETILEIGKKEQWLIDSWELLVDPQVCLGSGGFGVVVAGEFHGTPVALKLHTKTGSARPLIDIGNELRVLRKLRHPNIVLLHGACLNLNNSDIVLVMERVLGESMLQFINRKPAMAKRYKSLEDICHALMYLHSRHPPIVHGDLKPANIIVESRSMGIHAKLLDFGLARLLSRSAKPRGGTHRWMAPGALRSDGEIQLEDDVFAFGLVMFFSATGQKPFRSLSDKSLKSYAIGSRGAPPTLDWPSDAQCKPCCKALVELCTKELRKDRPSIRQVHDGLGDFGEHDSMGDSDSMRSDLWPALLMARRIAASKANQQKKLPHVARLQQERTKAAEAGHLAPVPEQDIVQDVRDAEPRSVRHPVFHPTPTYTMIAAIFDLLMSWNSVVATDACCEFHASVRQLCSLCALLSQQECTRMTVAGMHVYQCPACQTLIHDDEGGLRRLDCSGCGYAGPPGLHAATM